MFNDRKHGPQFKAHYLKAAPPTTAEGIRKYFASGMIKGIGPVYGRRLVAAFGQAVFEVIEASPERLREVAGIGPKRAARIEAGWADQKAIREIMIFLHGHGVSTSRAVRIYKTYGVDAIEVISQNPYQLARDIRGIGFRSADRIASSLGIEKTALARTRAGILYALSEAMNDGHCGLPDEVLLPATAKLLEVPEDVLAPALAAEIAADHAAIDTAFSMTAESRGPADIDRTQNPALAAAEPVALRLAKVGAVAADDVRHLQPWAHEDLRSAARPRGSIDRAGSGCRRSAWSQLWCSAPWSPAGHDRAGPE